MAASDSKAPLRTVKRVQFGILSPDECVSIFRNFRRGPNARIFLARRYADVFFCFRRSVVCRSPKAVSVSRKRWKADDPNSAVSWTPGKVSSIVSPGVKRVQVGDGVNGGGGGSYRWCGSLIRLYVLQVT